MTTALAPYPRFKAFIVGTNQPLVGGKLFAYLSGTNTPTNTYTDISGAVLNAWPVILDANGEADVWINSTCKIVLQDALGVQIWSKDNIGSGSVQQVNQISVGSYASLTAAVAAIGSTPTTLYIDSATILSGNTVVPSTLALQFVYPGSVAANGFNLTVNGVCNAGPYQIFTGFAAGQPLFSFKTITQAIWFGRVGPTFDGLAIYVGGTPVPGVTQDLPLATSALVINSYDNPAINNDRNFAFVSQMWSGETPAASPTNDKASIALAGQFNVHRGGNSGTFINSINTQISSAPCPTGTANTNGTAVTRVSGSQFLTGTGWENSVIAINSVVYLIVSVSDADHLTLKTSAGVQAGASFYVGGGVGIEIDVNAGEDQSSDNPLGMKGLIVASSGAGVTGAWAPHHAHTGINVTAISANGAWRNAAVLSGFSNYGLYISAPDASFPAALSFDVTNGVNAAGSVIRAGNRSLNLVGASDVSLVTQPANDAFVQAAIYGTTANAASIGYAIQQTGYFASNQGANVVAANSIFPTAPIVIVSGNATINFIQNYFIASTSGQLTLIPDANSTWKLGTANNIAIAANAVIGKPLIMTYAQLTNKWYPSYT